MDWTKPMGSASFGDGRFVSSRKGGRQSFLVFFLSLSLVSFEERIGTTRGRPVLVVGWN